MLPQILKLQHFFLVHKNFSCPQITPFSQTSSSEIIQTCERKFPLLKKSASLPTFKRIGKKLRQNFCPKVPSPGFWEKNSLLLGPCPQIIIPPKPQPFPGPVIILKPFIKNLPPLANLLKNNGP